MNENVFFKSACRCLATAVIKTAIHDGDVKWLENDPKGMFSFYRELSGDCITRAEAIRAAKIKAEKLKK